MNSPAEWARAFARQSDADFKTWEYLRDKQEVPLCHRLLFLQMACEKLCKAHLIVVGSDPDKIQSSHAYIAKQLPSIVKQLTARMEGNLKGGRRLLQAAHQIASEIEVLNPAVDRNGQRPDNCEYPWEDHGHIIHSPLDWTFSLSHLLTERNGPTLLKCVRISITRLL